MINRIYRRAGIALAGLLLSASSLAGNSDFSAGMSFGRDNGGVAKNEMDKAGNHIGEYVPAFDRDKAEQQYGGYYGGVKSSGRDMNAPGSAQFSGTEWGQSIQEHKRKAPDMPGVSAGDDFLKQGQRAIDNAQSMFDPNVCKSVSFDKVTTVKKTCERDLTGVDVFPYSLNGEADAAFPNAVPAPPAVVAAFFAQGLPVATPTTFLVNVNTMDTFPLLQGDATEAQITDRLDTVFIEALKRMNSLPGGTS